ncbi:MAG: hypothetical protein WCF78_03740 [archaeon]
MKLKPINKLNKQKKRINEVFDYLDKQYKEKEVIKKKVLPSFIEHSNRLKIINKLKDNQYVFARNKKKIEMYSNNFVFSGEIYEFKNNNPYLQILEIKRLQGKKLTDILQIKNMIEYLKKYCKEKSIPEIQMGTWMFESHPGFAEHLGFVSSNPQKLNEYRKYLLDNGITKITYLDNNVVPSTIHYLKKDASTNKLTEQKIPFIKFEVGFPPYVCKIK